MARATKAGLGEMVLADGSQHPHRGRMVFADRLIDSTTGTLLIDIAFPNPERIVRPGQYGRARVIRASLHGSGLIEWRVSPGGVIPTNWRSWS